MTPPRRVRDVSSPFPRPARSSAGLRRVGRLLAIVLCGWASPASADAPAGGSPNVRTPNVVVILMDDLGYADLGFQGCRDIPTPHLDALANAGVRCTDGYASCPVCSPTRAGLLTGRYQNRFGYEFLGGGGGRTDVGLPESETTVAELLRSAGYATGAVGKWHLGKEPAFRPRRHGFDEFYGFLGGGRSYFPMKEGEKITFAPFDPIVRDDARSDGARSDGGRVQDPEYLTDAFGREAVAFIDRHKGRPFFLYLAFNAVHVPLQATDRDLKRFPDIESGPRRTYAAMLAAADDAVGRVVGKLAAEGLDRDTLVVFLNDNGGHPLANAARNDPLRGQKGTVFEGGIRVPFVVSWPGRIPAGGVYSQPVASLDVLPTALAAAGGEPPAGLRLDGVNLLPHLTGSDDRPPHAALFWRYGDHRAVRAGRWKLTMPADGPPGLYDLVADVAESTDLSAAHPETLAELTRLFAAWDAELPPPRWPPSFMERTARSPAARKRPDVGRD